MLKKNLISFEPTTFSQKLTLYLPKTNFYSNELFFELDTTAVPFLKIAHTMYIHNLIENLFDFALVRLK